LNGRSAKRRMAEARQMHAKRITPMTRIADKAAVFLLALTVLTAAAAAQPAAEDAAVIKACIDVAEARSEAAANQRKNDDDQPPLSDEAQVKTGAEAHLDDAALNASHAPENCIGALADACMNSEAAQSTYDILECIGREAEVWDARLDSAYQEKLSQQAGPGSDEATLEVVTTQLRKIQFAWISWRDAMCEDLYSGGIPISGSSGKADAAYCHLRLTARQALWIEGRLTMSFE
jgi:uncharacterized protein YecT (DUF1311 family)